MSFHLLKMVTAVTVRGVELCVESVDPSISKKVDDITTNCDLGQDREIELSQRMAGTLEGPWDTDDDILGMLTNVDSSIDEPVVLTLGNGRSVNMPDCILEGGIKVSKGAASRFTIQFRSNGPYTIT